MSNDFRVYLRALEPDDYKVSIRWRKNDEIWDMMVGPKYFVSEAYEKKWVEDKIFHSPDMLVFAVCLKENNEYIGNVYISDIDWINRSASSGTLIGEKKYWAQGLATEAAILRLKFAFYDRGLNRMWAHQLETNIGAQKIAEKIGYKKEGLLRQAVYKNGRFHNLVVISVLREEFDEVMKTNKWV